MARVKFKCKGKPERSKKLKLLETLCKHEIPTVDIQDLKSDGFLLTFENESHVDKVFARDAKKDLTDEGFTPLLPLELKVKKSIIATRVNELIYEIDEEELKQELADCNSWFEEGDIDSIYKFTNSSTIKITFHQTAHAKKATEIGLLACKLSIPSYNIKLETYIPVKCCMKCYRLEEHTTRECDKPKEYKICSNCSEEGHLWMECKAETQCCINCNGEHSTMAMRCIKRKEIIKRKRKEEETRSKLTYAGITMTNSTQKQKYTHQTQQNIPTVTKDELLKIHTCIIHAHQRDLDNPGTYEQELNNALTLNNLPNIKIPPPVSAITATTQQQGQTQSQASGVTKAVPPKALKRSKHTEIIEAAATVSETEEMEEEVLMKDSTELGLIIYTSEEIGWPKDNQRFTHEDLVRHLRKNRYKYTYTNPKYTEDEILEMLRSGRIRFSKCWTIVGNDNFRKIRPGFQEERSPPLNQRDPRARKQSHHD